MSSDEGEVSHAWGPLGSLLTLWSEKIHPAASREQVAIAFAALAGGFALGVLGLLVAVFGDLILQRPASWMRELGFAAAAIGLPLFLLGAIVALPAKRWVQMGSAGGFVFTFLATALFVIWYPNNWNLTVQAPNGYAIGLYILGVSVLCAGAAASIGSYFVQRVTGRAGTDDGTGPNWTREDILSDIADAEKAGWSWGGIRDGAPKVKIVLKGDIEPLAFKGLGQRVRPAGSNAVEDDIKAASTLSKLRGAKKPEEASAVGGQVNYLKGLRARQAAQEAERRQSFWWRITHPFHH